MAGRKQLASHNDFVKLEALVESGLSVYQAAQQIGLPLGAFKSRNADPTWYAEIKAKEETCRAAKVDQVIDRRVENGEAGDALTKAWAARNNEAYREKQQLEISGTVNHEHKVVELGDVLDVIEGTGVDIGLPAAAGRPRAALPSADDLRPARPEPAAGSLPAVAES